MMNEKEIPTLLEKLTQELRRGVLGLAALSQLSEAKYGYSLISELAEKGLEIEQGTLYPLLRRLETQGLLESNWDVDGSRPRRYYVMTAVGRDVLKNLTSEWFSITEIMRSVLDEFGGNDGDN